MYAFDFSMPLNLGRLKDEQVFKLNQILKSKGFENRVTTPAIVINEKKPNIRVIYNTGEFSLKAGPGVSKEDFEECVNVIDQSMKSIIEESKTNVYTIRIAETYTSEKENAIDTLKGFMGFNLNEEPFDSFFGVGFRFLKKHDNLFDEFKMEPFLRDTDTLYIEGIYNYDRNCMLSVRDACYTSEESFSADVNKFLI